MADNLSRFPSAALSETCHHDENFTVARIRMINEALFPRDQLNPRGQTVNKIQKIPAVEGVRTCVGSRKRFIFNSNQKKN